MNRATTVRTRVDDELWHVTLDRPDRGNAVDPTLARDLLAALRDRPPATRAVLLDGSGPHFCVGGDVRGFAAADEPGESVGRLASEWHGAVRALVACEVPVVGAAHGAIAGAGVGLISACDLVLCARSARIRPAYIALGFSPDGGTTWGLTRALGRARTLDLLLADGELSGEEALAAGLVSRVVEDDVLASSARALAVQLARGPVRAMVRTRALVDRATNSGLGDQLEEEARQIAESADDPEGREGVRAFVERRTPDFLAT